MPLYDFAVVYQSSLDRVIAFATGSSGHLHVSYSNGTPWVWEDLGTPPPVDFPVRVDGMPAPVYQSSLDRVISFVRGNDQHLYVNYWNGSAWVWEDQGTPPGTIAIPPPAAVYQSSLDRVIAFVRGGDNHLYVNYWNGSAWVWEDQGTPPGTTVNGPPVAIYQAALDRVMAFVLGGDGKLYVNFWNGSQWVWEEVASSD
jgi:hypothetical protein